MKQLIATLGIPLDEAKQNFRFLNAEHKKQLRTKFGAACHKLKLPEITCDSFTYQLDYKHQFDAFDMANIATAVLNSPKSLTDAALKLEVGTNLDEVSLEFNSEQNFWAVFNQILDRFVHQEN